MKKIVLLGAPGCGKGTQSKLLVEKHNFFQLSTGDLLRDQTSNKGSKYGEQIKIIMKKGDLVSDDIVINLIIEKITVLKNENVIFDGFPRNIKQAKVLDESLENVSISLDSAILIDVDFKILEQRIENRIKESKSNEKREDDNIETLLKRIEVYKTNTFPIIEYYKKKGILRNVNGMDTIENVSQEISKFIN